MDVAELAARIDHTLLAPEATAAEVETLVEVAAARGCASACVHPSWIPTVVAALPSPSPTVACAVVGFPSGAHPSSVKAAEAGWASAAGAAELDMVIHVGRLLGGDDDAVRSDIAAVRAAAPDVLLKVIVESAALPVERLEAVCRMAVEVGADQVKTSTGFHPSGGASVEAVATMASVVGDRAGVKASGGIRTLADAEAMLGAGATRLGMSKTEAVLDELAARGS